MAVKRTKFQRWLVENGACAPGRRSVGRKTYAEFWRTCKRVDYLLWILVRTPGRPQCDFSVARAACPGCRWSARLYTHTTADTLRAEFARPKIKGLR